MKDPNDLTFHELAKSLPEWGRDDERFLSVARDIGERGIKYPLLIDRRDKIVDGRMRWRIAKQYQLVEVKCWLVKDEEVTATILGCLLHRRHLTAGARAYISFPLLAPAYEDHKQQHLARLRTGQRGPSSIQSTMVRTVGEFAEGYGFGRDLFYQAGKLHDIFSKSPPLKAELEPKILEGEIGLGACLAGIAGKEATDGKARRVGQQLELFSEAFDTLKTRFSYWGNFDSKMKERAYSDIDDTVSAMPGEVREAFKASIKKAEGGKR